MLTLSVVVNLHISKQVLAHEVGVPMAADGKLGSAMKRAGFVASSARDLALS